MTDKPNPWIDPRYPPRLPGESPCSFIAGADGWMHCDSHGWSGPTLQRSRVFVCPDATVPQALDWLSHLNAIRRLLVGEPPNVDAIDAAIGYAINDCEAAIRAALQPVQPNGDTDDR